MTLPTPINDALTNLELQVDAYLAKLQADHQSQVDGYLNTIARLTQQVADLADELTECQGIPSSTVFGCSKPNVIGLDGLAVPVARAYISVGKRPTAFDQLPREQQNAIQLAGHSIILSWKDSPGPWLVTLLADINRLFPKLLKVGCQNHEPFDNFTTPAQIANYHARWDIAQPMMSDAGWASTVILDGSHPESWDTFARADTTYLGVDRYNPGIADARTYVDPREVFGPYVEWLYQDRHDGQLGLVAETGCPVVPGDTNGAGQLEWILSAHAYLREHVEFACWWNVGALELDESRMYVWLTGELQ